MTGWEVIEGDCIDAMRAMPDQSVDAIVCDPPYGLSAEPTIAEVLRHWLAGDDYKHRGGGFMGRSWDSFVPGPVYWRECFRVLKPGGHLLAFSGTRTEDLLGIAIRLASFERRDTLTWLYGSGFPKSLDVGKAIDKAAGAEREVTREATREPVAGEVITFDVRGSQERERRDEPATPEAQAWQGWGTALKPAHEPVVLARKPLTGTVAGNVLEHGTGALNIDACRIGTGHDNGTGRDDERTANARYTDRGAVNFAATPGPRGGSPAGRWPANVVLSHTPGCVQIGTRRVESRSPSVPQPKFGSDNPGVSLDFRAGVGRNGERSEGYADAEGMETVEAWECEPDCPVRILDEQSGTTVSAGGQASLGAFRNGDIYGAGRDERWKADPDYGDQGGASRFFYAAKSSTAERNAGLDHLPDGDKRGQSAWGWSCNVCGCAFVDPATGRPKCAHDNFAWTQTRPAKNVHPTVKPIAVMRWLLRLVTPPGGTILDPFTGSGTTGCAAVLEPAVGRFIGVEREPEYAAIARARIQWWAEHGEDGLRILAEREARERAAEKQREERVTQGQTSIFDMLDG